MLSMTIVESLQFPNWGWWTLHVLGLFVGYIVGFILGHKRGKAEK